MNSTLTDAEQQRITEVVGVVGTWRSAAVAKLIDLIFHLLDEKPRWQKHTGKLILSTATSNGFTRSFKNVPSLQVRHKAQQNRRDRDARNRQAVSDRDLLQTEIAELRAERERVEPNHVETTAS